MVGHLLQRWWLYLILGIIKITHVVLMALNTISMFYLVIYEPFYIWVPMITILVSPLLGGQYCIFNHIENIYRIKLGLKPRSLT